MCTVFTEWTTRLLDLTVTIASCNYKSPFLSLICAGVWLYCDLSVPTTRPIWGRAWKQKAHPWRKGIRTISMTDSFEVLCIHILLFLLLIFFSSSWPSTFGHMPYFWNLLPWHVAESPTPFSFIIWSGNLNIYEYLSGSDILLPQSLSFPRDNVHTVYCPFLDPVAKPTE